MGCFFFLQDTHDDKKTQWCALQGVGVGMGVVGVTGLEWEQSGNRAAAACHRLPAHLSCSRCKGEQCLAHPLTPVFRTWLRNGAWHGGGGVVGWQEASVMGRVEVNDPASAEPQLGKPLTRHSGIYFMEKYQQPGRQSLAHFVPGWLM